MSFQNIEKIAGSERKRKLTCLDKKETKGRRKGNVKRGEILEILEIQEIQEIQEILDGDQGLVIGKETENAIGAVIEKKGTVNIEIGVGKGITGKEEMIVDIKDRVHRDIEMKKDMVGHVKAQEMTDMKDHQELKNKQRILGSA